MKQINWKIFLIALGVQFALNSLVHFGVRAPKLFDKLLISNYQNQVSPEAPQKDLLEEIHGKLTQTPTTFQLKKSAQLPSIVSPALAATDYQQAKAYLAIDFNSGQVLTSQNANQSLPIASLTKIMTAVVALDLASPDEQFTVTPRAAAMEPTKIGVVAGEKMSLTELLKASLLTSANDAVEVVRNGIDQKYGEGAFVAAMNEKAKFLGLKDTRFTDPQGLEPGDLSSAEDLVTLSHYAIKNYSLIASIASSDYQFLPADSNHKQFDLYNWNGLLGVYPGIKGLKIGNTDEAGYTIIVLSERDGKEVLTVLLGAPGVLERDLWASQVLDIGFSKLGLPSVNITKEQLKAKYATWKYWG